MVRDWRKACTSMLSNPKFCDVTYQRPLLAAMGQGELAIHAGVPVLQSFAMMMLRSSRGAKPAALHRDEIIRSGRATRKQWEAARWRSVEATTRLSFARSWGVSVDFQLALEAVFDKTVLPTGPLVKGQDISADWFFDVYRPECRRL